MILDKLKDFSLIIEALKLGKALLDKVDVWNSVLGSTKKSLRYLQNYSLIPATI